MTHTIIIPGWRPARTNQLLGGGHWSHAYKLKQRDKKWVETFAWFCKTPLAQGKRRVSLRITLAGRDKAADPDAYWKSLLDALVACGQLMNDSGWWCELGTVEHVKGEARQTEIILEDVE